jgi:hypothetical protein
MAARTGRSTLADPARHKTAVAAHAERFVIVGIKWGQLGANVPNEFVAEGVRSYGGRAVGLACVDPHDTDAPRELERAFTTLGLHGLKLSPVYQGFDPSSPEAWRLYEICDHYRKPILFHQAAAFAQQAVLEWGRPVLLDRVARTFPKLHLILAHLGQPWVEETVQLLRKHKQVFADLSARFYRHWQIYNGLMHAIDYGVTDQLLFGSDFPMQSTAEALTAFRAINEWGPGVALPRIPEETIESIVSRRPLSLVGWS